MGFGDSSLNFELRVRVQRIERRFSVMSDLNFAIDRAFRENGVTIPFPQRDLHVISTPKEIESVIPKSEPPRTEPPAPQHVTRSHQEEMSTDVPIDEVWAVLTDETNTPAWLKDTKLEMKLGGYFETALHDDLRVHGRVDVFRPPTRIRILVPSIVGEEPFPSGPITVEFELSAADGETKLVATIAGIPASEEWEEYYRLSVEAWQASLEDLKHQLLRHG